jgi:hypothetical protein
MKVFSFLVSCSCLCCITIYKKQKEIERESGTTYELLPNAGVMFLV